MLCAFASLSDRRLIRDTRYGCISNSVDSTLESASAHFRLHPQTTNHESLPCRYALRQEESTIGASTCFVYALSSADTSIEMFMHLHAGVNLIYSSHAALARKAASATMRPVPRRHEEPGAHSFAAIIVSAAHRTSHRLCLHGGSSCHIVTCRLGRRLSSRQSQAVSG